MISFPQPGQLSQYSYQAKEQQSDSVTVVKQQENGDALIRVQASSSSTVSISGYSSTSSLTYAPSQSSASGAISEAPTRTQAATNILKFIELRLTRDAAEGATPEELAVRLQEGLEGFLQGYNEAYEQISGAGLLGPEVEAAIQSTYDQVLEGIGELAERFGVEVPAGLDSARRVPEESSAPEDVPASPVTGNQTISSPQSALEKGIEDAARSANDLTRMIEASSLNYENLAERDFAFKLKTQDGDEVTIFASASRYESVNATAVNYADNYQNYSAGRFKASTSESSNFGFRVDGELDESELTAINDLLRQVGDISEAFFSGDIGQAFDLALKVGFDESEIARFSLNLKQSVTTRVEAAYAQVGQQSSLETPERQDMSKLAEDNSIAKLARFVDMLREAADNARKLGVEREVIPKFAERIALNERGDDPAVAGLKPLLDTLMDKLPEA